MCELRRDLRELGLGRHDLHIEGERGTGKELAAAAVHAIGRPRGSFLTLNASVLRPERAEAELFGYEKGAYTGADGMRIGMFLEAEGGTLFIDEIGALWLEVQPMLLRALEVRRARRAGGYRELPFTIRVVTATNRDLVIDAESGRFLPDLLDRILVTSIRLPALRERREDIAALVTHLAEQCDPIPRFSERAIQMLEDAPWPGNVRQLKNVVTQASCRVKARLVETEDLLRCRALMLSGAADSQRPKTLTGAPSVGGGGDLRANCTALIRAGHPDPLGHAQRVMLEVAYELAEGNVVEAAKYLTRPRRTVADMMAKAGIGKKGRGGGGGGPAASE